MEQDATHVIRLDVSVDPALTVEERDGVDRSLHETSHLLLRELLALLLVRLQDRQDKRRGAAGLTWMRLVRDPPSISSMTTHKQRSNM